MRKLSFLLEIYPLQGRFVQKLRLEIFRRKKLNSDVKFDIQRLNGFHDVYVFF